MNPTELEQREMMHCQDGVWPGHSGRALGGLESADVWHATPRGAPAVGGDQCTSLDVPTQKGQRI
jgi:hypothetical protein